MTASPQVGLSLSNESITTGGVSLDNDNITTGGFSLNNDSVTTGGCVPQQLQPHKCRRAFKTQQQCTGRQARERVVRRKGEIRGVNPVILEAADGTAVEPVAEFVYLGSNITRAGDVMKEVRRRIGMAGAVLATLGKVWDSSIVPMKLKSGLFRALMVSELLHNVECWPMRKNNADAVEGFTYRCLRRVTRVA